MMARHPETELRDYHIATLVPQTLFDEIEQARGDVSRSTWLYRLLQRWQKTNKKPTSEELADDSFDLTDQS